jgi:ribosomal protein S18 acetylase RimI-like enzyme
MRVRPATPNDIPALKDVQQSAGKAFEGLDVGYVADRTVSQELLQKLAGRGTLWVAVEDGNEIVGFAACYPLDGFFYLHEISVAQGQQGKGIGRRLMNVLEDYAFDQNYPYVGLVTFRDIRWNGPFYKSLGYKEIAPDLYSGLHNKYKDDIRHGMDPAMRCVMIKVIEG